MLAGAWPVKRSQLGIKIALPLSLTTDIWARYFGSAPYSQRRTGNFSLPLGLQAGYGIKITGRQQLHVEFSQQRLEGGEDADLIFGRHLKKLEELKFAWTLTPHAPGTPTPGSMFYRVGINRKSYYLSSLDGDPLGEIAATFGLGFRSLRSAYQVDIALKLGQRDALFESGKELFARVSIGITTGELWFTRQKKIWD